MFFIPELTNLANLILILTPGDATPTYDEPDESDSDTENKIDNTGSPKRKVYESAEEGECNDDGVELKPSLRIKNLPSPERETTGTENGTVKGTPEKIDQRSPEKIEKAEKGESPKKAVLLRRITDESPTMTHHDETEMTNERTGSVTPDLKMSDISSDDDGKDGKEEKESRKKRKKDKKEKKKADKKAKKEKKREKKRKREKSESTDVKLEIKQESKYMF